MYVQDDLTPRAAQPADDAPSDSRRGILTKGMKLAFAAPAVLVALQGGVALAARPDSDPDNDGDGNSQGRGRAKHQPNLPGGPRGAVSVPLCRVPDVQNGNDYPSNGGSNSLTSGEVRVTRGENGNADRVWVSLRGASPNTAYDVNFVRFNDHGREDLQSLTTDGGGNVSGFTPVALSGTSTKRVGVFVLIAGGQDQFVTCFPT